MRRAGVLGLLLAVIPLLVPAVAWAGGLRQSEDVVSGGIGLSRAAWEEEHDAGESEQGYVTYEGGSYYVQYRDDVVSFLEFGWTNPGVTFEEAEAAVLALIPSDARLAETFYAPATAGGPISFLLHRYDSLALVDALPAFAEAASGGILVLYQETAAPDRFEPNVSRVSIAVGSEP